MEEPTYKLGELSVEKAKALTEELKTVLEKYGCEMGVKANIEIYERIPLISEEQDPILSPYNNESDGNNETKTEEKPDSEAEESGNGDSEKPVEEQS